MTLTTRVSAFFLGWLGLSLAGFAITIYLVARADLYRRADDRLAGTLDALVAAAEVDKDGVEWEPHERTLPRGEGRDAVIWIVAVPDARVLDRSNPAAGDWLLTEPVDTLADPTGAAWRVARRRLDARTKGFRPPPIRTLEAQPQAVLKWHVVDVIAAVPVDPIRRDLNRLAALLTGLTAGLWLTAAVVGRWLCRRTLAPVAQMAVSARGIGPAAAGERLAVPATGDELEDLGRAFNGALDRLEEALERQRRFTGDASHQFRTPLAAMLGQVEVSLRRDRDAAEYRATLANLTDDIRHLNRLTEALLFLARADAEATLSDLQEINLPTWISDYVRDWQTRNADLRIEIIVESASPVPVRAHPELLTQLLDNLLDNTVKYASARSPVVIRLRAGGAGIELAVEDSGPGIAAEDLPHVFEPFFRSAAAREAGVRGVGLGLAIAKRIAEAMGAQLRAESVVGRGSRFAVQFPTLVNGPGASTGG
jgi:signal transduction histidine kinase